MLKGLTPVIIVFILQVVSVLAIGGIVAALFALAALGGGIGLTHGLKSLYWATMGKGDGTTEDDEPTEPLDQPDWWWQQQVVDGDAASGTTGAIWTGQTMTMPAPPPPQPAEPPPDVPAGVQ